MNGKGGRSRQGLGRIGQPPPGESFGPTSAVEDWFAARTAGATVAKESVGLADGTKDIVLVKPAGYWSLGVLPPMDATYVQHAWRVTYSSSGGSIITNAAGRDGYLTPDGRVTIITGQCFFAEVSSVGGPNAFGNLALADDNLAYNSVGLTLDMAGGPKFSHFTFTGGKDVPGSGPGFFNRGLLSAPSPIEIYAPPKTAIRARYLEITAPRTDIVNIGWMFDGYEVDATQFYQHISGTKR